MEPPRDQPARSTTLACVAALNSGELARLEPLLAPACKNLVPTLGRLPDGPLGLQMYWSLLEQALAPLHLEALDYRAKGQWEWVRLRILGIHTDEFMEFAPSFRYVGLEAVWKARVADGRLIETRLEFDPETLLAQLQSRPPGLPGAAQPRHFPNLKPE